MANNLIKNEFAARKLHHMLMFEPGLDGGEVVLEQSDIEAIRRAYHALLTVNKFEQDIAGLSKDIRNNKSEWADGMRKALQMFSSTIDEMM